MKTKHTPSPWKTEKHGFNVTNSKNDRIAFTGTERVNSMGGISLIPIDERKANAKLIAAAPELLEAARLFKNLIEKGFDYYGHDTLECLRITQEAIKKATE